MEIKLLIGLGNPGREYKNTYHNVGQIFVDELVGKEVRFKRTRYFEYVDSKGQILIKNLNFMNQSGGAVVSAKKYFGVKPGEILIIHDDSDIPLGNFKLSFGRGSAGHQGIESIIKTLKTNKFYRLRIGIRPTKKKVGLPTEVRQRRTKAGELVLKKIGARERKILHDLFGTVRASRLKINDEAHPTASLRRNP